MWKLLNWEKRWALEDKCTGKGNGEGGCNLLLLVSKDDLYFNVSVCDGHSTRYIFSFKCPICGLWFDINDVNMPYNIRKRIR